jgi:hypothetical protein
MQASTESIRGEMFSTEESELSAYEIALEHCRSWFELHASQRQNLLNFFLIAIAFLFNAYVGALGGHREILAALIGLLGALISFGFTLMDLRNRDLTRAGESPMMELERRMALRCDLPQLRIQEAINQPRRPWLSMGKIIRAIHITVAVVFVGATIYALVA